VPKEIHPRTIELVNAFESAFLLYACHCGNGSNTFDHKLS